MFTEDKDIEKDHKPLKFKTLYTMKKFASLLLVSILGGVISIGAYKVFSESPEKVEQASVIEQPTYVPTNFVNSPTTNAANAGIDFTHAAEKTVHAVVHEK